MELKDDVLLAQAEQRVRRILVELEERTGKHIDHVEVDTRNFANLRTEIHLVVPGPERV